MKEFKIGMNEKLDMLKFKNLGEEREKEINKSTSSPIQSTTLSNTLASLLHPKGIKVQVSTIVKETEDTKSFYLKPVKVESMPPFLTGQYVTLAVNIDGRTFKRPYSISSAPNSLEMYRITVKKEPHGIVSTYLFHECEVGNTFNLLGPFGHFTYQPLRDSKDVVFLAGGSGITPFMAFLQDQKFLEKIHSLTLFYGAKSEFDLIFKKEIDEVCSKNKKVKVIYVLSEQKRNDYAYGFIDEEKILQEGFANKSFFVSGPLKMYFSLDDIFKKLDIPNKFIRHEIFREIPEDLVEQNFQLTIKMNDKNLTIPCNGKETLLQSMEKGRVKTLVHCTVGECGFCRSKLLNGEVKTENSCVREADKEVHYIHPCVSYPLSDVTIEVPIK